MEAIIVLSIALNETLGEINQKNLKGCDIKTNEFTIHINKHFGFAISYFEDDYHIIFLSNMNNRWMIMDDTVSSDYIEEFAEIAVLSAAYIDRFKEEDRS